MDKKALYCLFFSFKGGVGRTSAMMNTARHLSKQKKRVLCIDFDLSAPGIDIFDRIEGAGFPSYNPTKYMYATDENNIGFIKSDEGKLKFKGGHIPLGSPELKKYIKHSPKGFLEFCQDYLLSITNPNDNNRPKLTYPHKLSHKYNNLDHQNDYLFLLPKDNITEGDIVMMRVCNHDDTIKFKNLLDTINIKELDPSLDDDNNPIEPEFVTYFKNQIEKEIKPDYVLVDGRPGMDAISKLAMKWFADCIVLAFNLNPWNLNGIISVYEDRVKNSPSQKNKPNVLLLASPVPEFAQRSDLYSNQFDLIRTKMKGARNSGADNKPGPIEVPQTDILLLRDILICDVEPQHMACAAYYKLANEIISENKDDIQNSINKALSFGRESDKLIELSTLANKYINNEAIEYEYGRLYLSIGREYKAREHFEKTNKIIEEQREDNITSPYTLDAILEYAKTILTIATHEISDIKKLSYNKDQERKARRYQIIQIDEALSKLKYIEKVEDIDIKNINNPALSPYISLKADLHLSRGQMADRKDGKEDFKKALEYFNTAIRLVDNNANSYFGRATANMYLINHYDRETVEHSIADLEQASSNKLEYIDPLFKSGQYYFSLSVYKIGNNEIQYFPIFEENFPFIQNELKYFGFESNDSESEIHFDFEQLALAERKMQIVKDKYQEFALAYFYLGMISLIKTKNSEVDSEKSFYFKEAINFFSTTSLYSPTFSPAYLYSGLSQFLLNDLNSTEENSLMENIRFRQAFYRMEHFIDLNFIHICNDNYDKKHENREPFYFDGNPGQDIDTIKKTFKEGKYDFPLTLERKLNLPSMVNILRTRKEFKDEYKESFISMIKDKYENNE